MKKPLSIVLVGLFMLAGCSDDGSSTNSASPEPDAGVQPDSSSDPDSGDPMTGNLVGTDQLDFTDGTFAVEVRENADGTRTYAATTTYGNLLAGLPSSRTFSESPDRLRLRSGRLAFDALFALAVWEADENAVEEIRDGAFNDGNGVPCSCYETGENWNYVWTRDTAYAVDLGLGWIDPERARRSLEFKLSSSDGGPEQVVQDTGTGGSWPVSTDRVTWFIGSGTIARFLDEPESFRERRGAAARAVTDLDRDAVFDEQRGLYRGEQSFLDWREQSYPRWTATDTRHIAQSHSLSTNIAHWHALQRAGSQADADALQDSIVETFWDDDAGLYRAMTATELDGSVPAKYDLLGNSLAVLSGFPHRERVVASYPYGPHGASVIWPQQPRIPIYHNRGQWPFVTAYAALAAGQAGNAEVFSRNADALIRGAALNLSNMENFEFLSGHPYVEDGQFSGPVVNSRRQLWSVAGFIGLIVEGMFGLRADKVGGSDVYVSARNAFIPVAMRSAYFPDSTQLRLENVIVGGVAHSVTLVIPPAEDDSEYFSIPLDFDYAGETTGVDQTYVLEGVAPVEPATITEIADPSDFRNVFAPVEPTDLTVVRNGSGVDLAWTEPEPGVTYDLYRNGELVASDLAQTTWNETIDLVTNSPCYSVVAKFPTGLESHPSQPVCWLGENGARVQIQDVWTMAWDGGVWSTEHGRPHVGSWGDPDHSITGAPFRPDWTGRHAVQLIYGNGSNGFTTGITAAVKRLTLQNLTDGTSETRWFVMPQRATWENWGPSTIQYFDLDASKLYSWRLEDGVNMSYFDHFDSYTGGAGGGAMPFNAANVHAIEFLPLAGQAAPASGRGPIPLNGVSDFDKYASEYTLTPGAPLQAWSRFGFYASDDDLYVTQVSEAFEADYKPWMLYFGDGDSATGSRQGIEYSGLTAELPFAADWAVSLRTLSDDGSESGPWNGVFRWDGAEWVRERRFAPGRDWWLAADRHTVSVRIPRATFRGANSVELSAHIVYAEAGNEWKETVPAGHTPWDTSSTGYFVIDLESGLPFDDER